MTNEVSATEAVQSVIARVAHHIDARRWDELRALYTDMVETDYTSLFGGEVVDQRADDLVLGTWRTVLTPLDATHHLLGPITVDVRGDAAIADCHVRAVHVASRAKSGTEWTVAGHYVFELARTPTGWKIRKMKLETSYQTGNPKLVQEAAQT
jgi:3-phenylpropionate/cinnamic acid dioxygenase small subunit